VIANDNLKQEYVVKLCKTPLDVIILREAYQQIIDTLTSTNEALNKNITDFQEVIGDMDAEKLSLVTQSFERDLSKINSRLTELRLAKR
jgi:hypothetical protein